MAIVEGETETLLKYEYQNIEDIGQHIFRLIEQNVKQEYMISLHFIKLPMISIHLKRICHAYY